MPADEPLPSGRTFDLHTIKVLVALMSRHDLSEVDLIDGDQRIRLRRGQRVAALAGGTPTVASGPVANLAPVPAPAPGAPSAAAGASASAKPVNTIKSPTPGTFYAGANPDAPPFVAVGARVAPQTVVCIIEAMKIFNEIQAECSGVITKVLVQNQQPVEYDQPLFEVDPTG